MAENQTVLLAKLCGKHDPPLHEIKALLDQGVNLHVDGTHRSDAMYAATVRTYPRRRSQIRLVKLLVEEGGADIHRNSSKAFRNAVEAGDTEVVEYLIEKGVNFRINCDESTDYLVHSINRDNYSQKTRIELMRIFLQAFSRQKTTG
jgi:hypothetical protein